MPQDKDSPDDGGDLGLADIFPDGAPDLGRADEARIQRENRTGDSESPGRSDVTPPAREGTSVPGAPFKNDAPDPSEYDEALDDVRTMDELKDFLKTTLRSRPLEVATSGRRQLNTASSTDSFRGDAIQMQLRSERDMYDYLKSNMYDPSVSFEDNFRNFQRSTFFVAGCDIMEFDTFFSYAHNNNSMYTLWFQCLMNESAKLDKEYPERDLIGTGSITDERNGSVVKTHNYLCDGRGVKEQNRNYKDLLKAFLKAHPLPKDRDENDLLFRAGSVLTSAEFTATADLMSAFTKAFCMPRQRQSCK